MQIYLVRHTSVNIPTGVCYGQTNVLPSASFKEEAERVKEKLGNITADIVFTSPLKRCVQLASYCGYADAIVDNRLMELNFGDWEGKKWDELDMAVWNDDWVNVPPPEGESFHEMVSRVTSFFEELKKKSYQEVLIFTHAGVINSAKVYFGQTPIDKAFDNTIGYGGIVDFNLDT